MKPSASLLGQSKVDRCFSHNTWSFDVRCGGSKTVRAADGLGRLEQEKVTGMSGVMEWTNKEFMKY